MGRIVAYAAALFASLAGWHLGRLLNPAVGYLLSTVLGAVAMYLARRWWQQNMS